MKNRKTIRIILYLLLGFNVACGSWLGNPSDFDGSAGGGTKESPDSEPTPGSDPDNSNVPVYLSLLGVNEGKVVTANKTGLLETIAIASIAVHLPTVTMGDTKLTNNEVLDISSGLVKIGEVDKATKIKNILLSWNPNSFSLQGSFKTKSLVLPLSLQSTASTITLSKEVVISKPLYIQIDLQKILDFRNKNVDFDSFDTLNFTNVDTPLKKSFIQGIQARVNNNLTSGVDEDEDGDVEQEERVGGADEVEDPIDSIVIEDAEDAEDAEDD